MNGRPKHRFLGTLAFSVALLSATSLTALADDGPAPADAAPAAAEAPAPAGADLDAILEEAGAAPDAEASSPEGAPAAEAPAAAAEAPAGPLVIEEAGPAVEIPVPTDPIAKAAFDVLDKHCARCHQDGKLGGGRLNPAKNFGYVLMLDQLAANPHYIAPGNPDGSKIVTQLLNKEMPYDVYYEANLVYDAPSEAEVMALRTWITKLGESRAAACTDRDFVTPVEMVSAMAADLEGIQPTRVADTRYITLTHLYNACAGDQEMEVYRQGTVKLLNSLSRVSDVVRLETVDPAKTIIRFNLKDLGWDADDWETILSVYPYPAKPDSQMYDLLSTTTLTPLPWVRGDWFAFTASQPPLYDKLLKLPDTFGELQAQLSLNTLANLEKFIAKRSGFQKSGVSRNNRLIERHTIPTGYFWTSYDFAGNKGRQSLYEFPLGPGNGEFDFKEDGGETIFSLPNGFQGYYLNTADGKKLLKGPVQIVLDPTRRDQSVTNGISCMGCHDQGIRKAADGVREHVLANRTFPKSVRDAVEALYPPVEEMDAILAADAAKFRNAMVAAGLDPTLKWNGVEMVNALSKRYEDDVELSLAAAEFGQSADDFVLSLEGAGDEIATRLGRRLDQGLVPRDTFEGEYLKLVETVSDLELVDLKTVVAADTPKPEVPKTTRPVEDSRTFDLALISDASAYKVGDLPVFTVTPAHDCYLTLINVDAYGVATVLYPNKFEKQNFLKAGQDFKFPAETAPYQFRFADPGKETVIAVCSLQDHPVDSIKIDVASDFTSLGDYEKHLTRAIKVEGKSAVPEGGKQTTPDDVVARTAIKMEIGG